MLSSATLDSLDRSSSRAIGASRLRARRRKAGGACDDHLPGAAEAQGRPLRYHGGISKVPAVEVQLRVRRAWREGPRKNKGPISVDIVCVAQRERLTMAWASVRECPPTVASPTT